MKELMLAIIATILLIGSFALFGIYEKECNDKGGGLC